VHLTNGAVRTLHHPADMPDPMSIDHVEEPWIKATILVPDAYLGPILALCEVRRGEQVDLTYAGARAMLTYRLPLNEVVSDFYDRLKSVSRGYASFDYQHDDLPGGRSGIDEHTGQWRARRRALGHRPSQRGRAARPCAVRAIEGPDPTQLFQGAVQAAIGGRIIARETVKALRKYVLAKCYGGNVTHKRKLLEKQKEGKKRMRQFGKVEIPQSAFITALKMGDS
jgi:GTP-binding protein LepA